MPPRRERGRRILEIDHGDDAQHVGTGSLRHGEGAVELLEAGCGSTIGVEVRQAVPALRAVGPGEVEPALGPRKRRGERRHRERSPRGGERGARGGDRNVSRRPPGGGPPRRTRSMERITRELSQVTFVATRPRPPSTPAWIWYPTPACTQAQTARDRGPAGRGDRQKDSRRSPHGQPPRAYSLCFSAYRYRALTEPQVLCFAGVAWQSGERPPRHVT